ncbi:MAG: hypothetical protein AAGH15_04395 [Myxococcota bacterium]
MSRPRATVHARLRGESSPEELHRAFVEHREWLVPLQFYRALHGDAMAQARKMSFGARTAVPPEELWLFTEQGTAQQASNQGALLGTYVLGVDGVELFQSLPATVAAVRVNAGGFDGDLLSFEGGALDGLRDWAVAVRIERGLAAGDDPRATPELMASLRSFRAYHVPVFADGRLIAKAGHEGFQQPAVVCTAPDAFAGFLGALDAGMQAQVELRRLGAQELMAEVERQGIDALYLNPVGPGPARVLPRAVCDAIVAAP